MTLKDEILKKSGLNEMARAELMKILPLIKKGKISDAAEKYIEIGGNPSGVTKTVNTFLKKNPKEDEKVLKSFGQEVVKIAREKGIASKRSVPHKTTKVGKTKEGKIQVFALGHSPQKRVKTLMKKINKLEDEITQEEKTLKSGNLVKLQNLANTIHKDIGGKDELSDYLLDFTKTGNNKEGAIKIMTKIIKDGKDNIMKLKTIVQNLDLVKPNSDVVLKKLEKRYEIINKGKK